jgi:acetyl-CoA carboxylase biotin carboxyl carrier protein
MAKGKGRGSDTTPDPVDSARALAELAVQHDLKELEVEHAGMRVRVVREHPVGPLAAVAAPPRLEPATPAGAQIGRAEAPATEPHLVTIEAPMVGTFYRAPSPEAPPYVSEGDMVKPGQIVCIVEAMKLMNEIESRAAGRIVKVLADNAQPVEFGQPLFLVDPRV